MTKHSKLLILDMDGTFRQSKSGKPFIDHPDDQVLIPEAVGAAIRWQDAGWAIVGASNQGGVPQWKDGFWCQLEQKATVALASKVGINLLDILYSPGTGFDLMSASGEIKATAEKPIYRKPNPGMLFAALHTWAEDDARVVMSGDMKSDSDAVKAANETIDPANHITFLPVGIWWDSDPLHHEH
jgi:D-glycero-D-manno-heptose 1,7-bisphosphate phosphatase